jgi:hypothetical protein
VAETIFPQAGEDTAELLGSIEEIFGIRFTQDDAFPQTVGELCQSIKSHLTGARTPKCMSSVTFYALRRKITRELGCRRDSITPSTRLESILSAGAQRRIEWKQIETSLVLKMPSLTFSQSVETLLSLTFFGIGAVIVLFVLPKLIHSIGDRIVGFCLTCFVAFILWAITRAKLQPWATQLPSGTATVGELTKAILAKNYGKVAERSGGWNEKELWNALRDAIADAASIDRELITPETPFPDGLGIF